MENWVDIPGLNGFYQASDAGRIRSVERKVRIGGHHRIIKESIVNPFKCSNGYMAVNLTYPVRKQHLVHRLIVSAFFGLKDGLVVNHKDLDKSNNSVSNLEQITQKENIMHSCMNDRNGRIVLNTSTGIYYYTIKEAAESCGMSETSLGKSISGRTKVKTNFIYA
jgi:hypothetical protein